MNPSNGTTIFHKIQRGEIPADIVYQDEHLFAFRDIAPQAPVHVLFVPRVDIATMNDLQADQADVVYLWPVRERVDVIERPVPYWWGSPWGWWY